MGAYSALHVATDTLELKHKAISINGADYKFII